MASGGVVVAGGAVEEGFKVAGMMGDPAGKLLESGMPLQIFQEVSPNPPKRYLYINYCMPLRSCILSL